MVFRQNCSYNQIYKLTIFNFKIYLKYLNPILKFLFSVSRNKNGNMDIAIIIDQVFINYIKERHF